MATKPKKFTKVYYNSVLIKAANAQACLTMLVMV